MCAKLIVMGRGGELCFQGSPDEALRFFEADTYDDVYAALDRRPATEWRQQFLAEQRQQPVPEEPEAQPSVAAGRAGAKRRASLVRQSVVLTRRYAQLFLRDRRNLLILIGQVPVLALAIVGLFKVQAFSGRTQVSEAVKLLFLAVTLAIWIGSIDAAREIVKEKHVYVREAAVGVRLGAYLTSKAVVLFALAGIQVLLLVGVIFAFQPLHHPAGTYGVVVAMLLLTAFAAVGMGLLMSAAVRTQDQATSFIPLILIPQLFFGGSIVPIATMSAPLAALSNVIVANWSYAGVGSELGLNARIAADRAYSRISGFGTEYFDAASRSVILILLAFIVVSFVGAALLLRRQSAG
jgi:ABC-type multidrug transport system permease subunit